MVKINGVVVLCSRQVCSAHFKSGGEDRPQQEPTLTAAPVT